MIRHLQVAFLLAAVIFCVAILQFQTSASQPVSILSNHLVEFDSNSFQMEYNTQLEHNSLKQPDPQLPYSFITTSDGKVIKVKNVPGDNGFKFSLYNPLQP